MLVVYEIFIGRLLKAQMRQVLWYSSLQYLEGLLARGGSIPGTGRLRCLIRRFRLLNPACAVLNVEVGVKATKHLLMVAVIMRGGGILLLRRHFQNVIKRKIRVLLPNDTGAYCSLGRLETWMKEGWLASPEVSCPP